MDIGRGIAYKRRVPQRGCVHREEKSNGEETQEGKENRSEKVAQDLYQVLNNDRGPFLGVLGPMNRSREPRRAAGQLAGGPSLFP